MSRHSDDVHTPRYIVRRRTVRDVIGALPPDRFLEIGCGRGEMLPMLYGYGHTGAAVEISESVFPQAAATAAAWPDIAVFPSLDGIPGETFQYLFAFEVLEHIEDDAGALREWLRYLNPEGRVVISVPAHMKLWTAADEAVGHIRRYERHELISLLENNGLEIVEVRTFGYPLVLLTRPLRHLQHRLRGDSKQSADQRTLNSSEDSTLTVPRRIRPLVRMAVQAVSIGFYYLGLPLRRTDFGDGYLIVAQRPTS